MTEEELWYKFDLIFHNTYWSRAMSYEKVEDNTLSIRLRNGDELFFVYWNERSWKLYMNDYRL